jgi:hypothetical protein
MSTMPREVRLRERPEDDDVALGCGKRGTRDGGKFFSSSQHVAELSRPPRTRTASIRLYDALRADAVVMMTTVFEKSAVAPGRPVRRRSPNTWRSKLNTSTRLLDLVAKRRTLYGRRRTAR